MFNWFKNVSSLEGEIFVGVAYAKHCLAPVFSKNVYSREFKNRWIALAWAKLKAMSLDYSPEYASADYGVYFSVERKENDE